MNEVEHARKLQELNRANREFYEKAETKYQDLVHMCPPEALTPDRVLEFQDEAAGIVRRELDFLASPLHETQQSLALIRTKPIPKFNSPDKTAIALALLQNHEASDLTICDAVDDTRALQTLDAATPLLADEYRNKKTRRKVEVRISKVRRVLRDKGFSV